MHRRGQALLEYTLALAGMTVIVAILWGLVRTTIKYADRTENLVAADCP